MRPTAIFLNFFKSEKAGGIILIFATAFSLIIANTSFGDAYTSVWNFNIADYSVVHWINDGLMTIFFLLIGLELEREIYNGELSDIKNAYLPIFGAVGGIALPALIYYFINNGTGYENGIGIPMATDIAFAIGIMSLLGKRVPLTLKVFLTALAIIDDLAAIIIIAVFYSQGLVLTNLFIALGIFVILLVLNRMKVHVLLPYLIGGVIMWYFMHNSGVHATITGVLLAFAIPFGKGDHTSISNKLENFLHKPVAFIILPLFALANTAIILGSGWMNNFIEPYSMGIILGLLVGKPIGILLFSLLGAALGLCILPGNLKWKNIFGVGLLAGIGFTMSIFIANLAFEDANIIDNAKIAILAASLMAAVSGFLVLRFTLKEKVISDEIVEEEVINEKVEEGKFVS